jgi:hypothetical protein
VKWLALLASSIVAFAADGPRVIYAKSFPGSDPAYMLISVQKDGAASYNESTDPDNAETFKLEPATVGAIFDYARKLGNFKGTLESGLKVANMGAKTLRWEDGAETSEAKFNYSQDENVAKLVDLFEAISESERLFGQLKRAIRFDKLGVNDAVLRVNILYNQKRLMGIPQYLPLLERIAKDESFLHMARERAAALADGVRAASGEKSGGEKSQ